MRYIGTATDISHKEAIRDVIIARNGTREEFMRECPKDEYNDSKLKYLEYEQMMWGISKWGFTPRYPYE